MGSSDSESDKSKIKSRKVKKCKKKKEITSKPRNALNNQVASSEDDDEHSSRSNSPIHNDEDGDSSRSDTPPIPSSEGEMSMKTSPLKNGMGVQNKKEKKQSRKAKESAMKEIYSESNRMLRESAVGLPYHRPRQRTLDEFLNRKKNLPDVLPVFSGLKLR